LVEFYRENRQAIDRCIFILLTLVAVYIFARFLVAYFAPFIVGYVISLLIGRPVDFLHKKTRIWRGVCTLFMILLLMSAILAGGFLIISRLLREIESFAQRLPEYTEVVQGVISRAHQWLEGINLPYEWGVSLTDIVADFGTDAASNLGTFVTQATINTATALPRFVLFVIFSIISAFFFTKDRILIVEALANVLPSGTMRSLRRFKRGLLTAAGGYIRAQLILMSLVIAICFLGLTIIGNPYAIFIGLGIGVLDLLPILGAGAVLVPWAVVSFIAGNASLGVSLLVLYGICMLTRQSLEPKIVGEQIGVHPLLTLMAIFFGLTMFGSLGIILGPFIAIAIKVAFSKDEEPEAIVSQLESSPNE